MSNKNPIFAIGIKILIVMALCYVAVLPLVNAQSLFEYSINSTSADSFFVHASQWVRQSITIGTTGANQNIKLTSISIHAEKNAAGLSDMNMTIYNASGFQLGTNNTFYTAIGTAGWYGINITGINLTAGQSYNITFKSSTGDGTNNIGLFGVLANAYVGGQAKISANQGTTWTSTGDWDIDFAIYGNQDCTNSVCLPTENSQTYNTTTYETINEGFALNLSYNSTQWSSISANLIYNGTSYTGTKTLIGDNAIFTKAITTGSLSPANYNFYWTGAVSNSTSTYYFNSSTKTQTISSIQLGLCNATLIFPFINITTYDETNLTKMNFTIPLATINYWLGDRSNAKTLSYTSSILNNSYQFCFSQSNKTLSISSMIQYSSASYPQRTISQTFSLTNQSTDDKLYLLDSGSGIYVTFQVINPAKQTLSGILVIANRTISGNPYTIGNILTGTDGAVTFFLNYNFQHTFDFTKSGWNELITSLFPTQNQYTITLSQIGVTSNDYVQGIDYSINPIDAPLINNTNYHFNYTISSGTYTLDSFGFNLLFSNGTTITTQSATTNGGTLDTIANTENAQGIIMNYYYIINGTSFNMTRTWVIFQEGSSFSLWNLISDFKTFTSDGIGIFGLKSNNVGMNIFIYFIILITIGICSWKFGLTTPSAILGILFIMVALFDVVLGLIYNPINAIPNFPTILIGIILVGEILREVYI